MFPDISTAKAAGAEGVVIGALDRGAASIHALTRRLAEAARPWR